MNGVSQVEALNSKALKHLRKVSFIHFNMSPPLSYFQRFFVSCARLS